MTRLSRGRPCVLVAAILALAACGGDSATGPAPVVRLSVARATDTLVAGDSLTLVAQPEDASNNPVASPVTWTSSDPATVSVVGSVAVALRAGTATLTAASGNVTATVQAVVLPALTRIRTIPAAVFVAPGGTFHVAGEAFTDTTRIPGRPFTYVSANPGVATVDASGIVHGVSSGTTTITVTTSRLSAVIPVTVAPAGPGTFSIIVRSYGHVNTTVMAAATAAAARWDRILTVPLTMYHVIASAGDCGPGTPAMDEMVQNMVIYVTTDSIDGHGKIAGEGGPCILRDPPEAPLTAVGFVTIDSADVASASEGGVLVDLLTHEMGHILGIGTLWDTSHLTGTIWTPGMFAAGLGGTDPRFIGEKARVASASLGFTADSTQGVPIENTGGAGTRDGHWRATVFGRELMTGTLHNNGNPISLVTVEALADFGYGVSPSGADDFSTLNLKAPFGISADRNVPTGQVYQIQERVLQPRFFVTPEGVLRPIPGYGWRRPR